MGSAPWSVPVRILPWPEAPVALEARVAATPIGDVVLLIGRGVRPGPGATRALAGLELVRTTRAQALTDLLEDLSDHPEARGRLDEDATAVLAGPAVALDALLRELTDDGCVGVLTTGTPFARAVMTALVAVPEGRTITYGELAERAGAPRAARAVGTVMARTLVPLVVPCHRVVPASGGIGAYGPHPRLKRTLLELEGAFA